ncbi:MAG TPA: CPBP family intramembrane glutamic endopeptidase [Chryseosolibacter sp.]|nr:CPBP family intramembrane glutamic endopeptidase [Chryseosolibacter sp.]
MKKVWHYLVKHVKEDFHAAHYAVVLIILTASLAFNYTVDFEDRYLDTLPPIKRLLAYFAMYTTLFYATVLSSAFFTKSSPFRSRKFWIISLAGLVCLSVDAGAPFLNWMLAGNIPNQLYIWAFKVLNNLMSFFIVFIPIIILHRCIETNDRSLYGLKRQAFDAKPYFTMLLIMLPLMIIVSFQSGFQKQYPMYHPTQAHEYLGVGEWFTVLSYEIAYGLDFITVEYLFRGLFVIGLAPFLNRSGVLAMAVIYCSLHFGKPAGEAISSIFGGYILGVVAYETKSVWGGVIVHVGIAWLMEIIGFAHKFL